ncbi:MAG: DUF6737 family protein [Cyanobacteria bacterium P01_H01_bin.119]
MAKRASTPKADAPNAGQKSIWHYKPWWCQPWSILLTGNGLIVASWLGFHRYWLTGTVAVPLIAWMVFFVGVYPRAIAASGLLEELAQQKH